ncbi:hypothetical protein [Granulosicoccus antarcticus]|uniref:Uncharacterized protein n=1 Tax=Granulosicoccus antarcticus IMCC3135 TaxID=1192854 RepID=A0A2Z2NLM6_9GAMM|nr:hypothetical protein [Granulosicoccus antarcticus]ASJ70871.1 hypothetical protein IMCC3135_03790 [Granulosicoccus antarcticus IMCC3135]
MDTHRYIRFVTIMSAASFTTMASMQSDADHTTSEAVDSIILIAPDDSEKNILLEQDGAVLHFQDHANDSGPDASEDTGTRIGAALSPRARYELPPVTL